MSRIEWTVRRWSLPEGSGSLRGMALKGLSCPWLFLLLSQSGQFSSAPKQWSQQTMG